MVRSVIEWNIGRFEKFRRPISFIKYSEMNFESFVDPNESIDYENV